MWRGAKSDTSNEDVVTAVKRARRKRRTEAVGGDVDLCGILEEVVETVCAGHNWLRSGGSEQRSASASVRLTSFDAGDEKAHSMFEDDREARSKDVSLILDIDNDGRPRWSFKTQAGAWRRIIMNLVGNALKYTNKGFVHVRLRARPVEGNKNASEVELKVSDTGCGISKEFLDTQLFTPFAQEDALMPGTGLGLAIIRRIIVPEMGGTIDVHSEKGKGTECLVRVVLSDSLPTMETESYTMTKESVAALRGIKVGFLGFGDVASATSSGDRDASRSSALLGHSLYRICRDWGAMDAVSLPTADRTSVDICIISETAVDELRAANGVKFADRYGLTVKTPILVASQHSGRLSRSEDVEHDLVVRAMEQISLPCGPRKLLLILADCLRKRREEGAEEVVLPTDQETHDEETPAAAKELVENEAMSQVDVTEPTTEDAVSKTVDTVVHRPVSRRADTHPARPEDVRRMSVPDLSSPPNGPDSKRVLIVDDNPVNVQLLVMFMRKHGHAYQTAKNGLDALQKFQAATGGVEAGDAPPDSSRQGSVSTPAQLNGFDYILMDISMPVMVRQQIPAS